MTKAQYRQEFIKVMATATLFYFAFRVLDEFNI